MTSTVVEDTHSSPAVESHMRRVLITPAVAREFLGRNPRNRHIQKRWVLELAELMKTGQFKEIGDTIRISVDGELLDGQHRLTAIVESGVSIEMWVAEGLAADSQDAMDRGHRRTVGDVLDIHGYAQGPQLAAAAKWAMAWSGKKMSTKNERMLAFNPTPKGTLQFLQDHPALADSLPVGRQAKDAPFRYPPSVAQALHYLFATRAGVEAADQFFALLFTGEDLVRGDPLYALRDQLIRASQAKNGTRTPSLNIFMWTVDAWNAWRAGRPAKMFKMYPGRVPEISE